MKNNLSITDMLYEIELGDIFLSKSTQLPHQPMIYR